MAFHLQSDLRRRKCHVVGYFYFHVLHDPHCKPPAIFRDLDKDRHDDHLGMVQGHHL